MLRFDTTKQMVLPGRLAITTTPSMLVRGGHGHYRRGFAGLGQDSSDGGGITLQDVISWGTSAATTYMQFSNVSDMVTQINSSLAQLSAQYQSMKAAGQLSLSVINQYETAVRNLLNSFCGYVSTQGVAGQSGCATVTQSVNQMIQSWELDKASLGVLGGALSWPLLLVGGLILWKFLK